MSERSCKLSKAEIQQAFADGHGSQFPVILTVAELAALARIPTKTIYEWIAKGRLDGATAPFPYFLTERNGDMSSDKHRTRVGDRVTIYPREKKELIVQTSGTTENTNASPWKPATRRWQPNELSRLMPPWQVASTPLPRRQPRSTQR